VAETVTFPMVSRPGPAPTPDAKLRAELARPQAVLAAHMAKRPGWENINVRSAWVHAKDGILTEIGLVEGQLRNRWHPVEVVR